MEKYLVLAFYVLKKIESPHAEVTRFHQFFSDKDAKGRIYISEEGINAQLSILKSDSELFFDWFLSDERFKGTDIKIHHSSEQAFPRMTIKYREQLVALDQKVDLSLGGDHISPAEWKKMLESKDPNIIVIDVRNDYEWEVGHFVGAEKPNYETFREFPKYAKELRERCDPKTTRVLMYCTGGIRCELYSCLMKEEGFDSVYQLDGGVIKYGLEVGNDHWLGNLFVFDDRLVVPIDDQEENQIISKCYDCGIATDRYINCANMDCNKLFLCCYKCGENNKGCCSKECMEAPRTREFVQKERPKPFRKLPFEKKVEMNAKLSKTSS